MSPREFIRFPYALVDSLVLYPLQQYVVSKVVEGLEWLDSAQDVFPEE